MKFIFLTQDKLLSSAPKSIAEIFAGGRTELKECRERGYIPDFFSCDPDYLRWEGQQFAFVELVHGAKHYVISDDDLPTESIKYIEAMFGQHGDLLFDADNTWLWFHAAKYAIAYRGGHGYSYSIWGINYEPK